MAQLPQFVFDNGTGWTLAWRSYAFSCFGCIPCVALVVHKEFQRLTEGFKAFTAFSCQQAGQHSFYVADIPCRVYWLGIVPC
jgi:hypothetical protein